MIKTDQNKQNSKNPKFEFLGTSMHAHARSMRMHALSMRMHTCPETQF